MWTLFDSRVWDDERGAGTIWGLLWFALFVGICGLSVDITNGFRARTMLQSTADAAALAGAIDLPVKATAVQTAVDYSASNMDADVSGNVLLPSDVQVGRWDNATKTLDTGSLLPDSVMVTVYQAAQNENPLPVNFLRIIGLMDWNVKAQAVAQRFIPDCLQDGLVARGIVNMSSNNGFYNQICIHGQKGVDVQSNNYFEAGVNVSMPSLELLKTPSSGFTSNTGLQQALREQILDPRMVNHVDDIMLSFLDPNWDNQASFIDKSKPVIEVDEKFDLSTAEPGRIYHVLCKANKNAQIPANTMVHDVVIIADCEVNILSGAFVYNAVLGSRSGGNGKVSNANVSAAANVQLGMPDNCNPTNGVTLLSNATIHTSSTTAMDGVQIIAAGDVDLGARDMGINGINVQAGGDINLTSNNMFGLCATGAPSLFTVNYYRLVL
jgi:hypothetical protein